VISKLTIFSLLFALMVGTRIVQWDLGHQDACTRYLEGDKKAQATVLISVGPRQVEMPCEIWLPRQPNWVQGLCLLDLLLVVAFLLNAALDAQRAFLLWRARRAVV
jgi:hypothetical protein